MENKANHPQFTQVLYNNVVIFQHERKDIAIEFAISLHRSSNIPHTISVGNDVDTFVDLFTL